MLETRNKIFVETGIPVLKKNGFEQSPFTTAWWGRNNLKDFSYELCRVTANAHLEVIVTHISRGDRWIKIFLNVFELQPAVHSLQQIKGQEGLQFHLPPNSINQMRLRIDDFKGMPLFNTIQHKIKCFHTERGFKRRVDKLSWLIVKDLSNIDYFVGRWHELHTPMITDWNGRKIDK